MPFYEDYEKDFSMYFYGDIPAPNAGMHVHPQYEMLVVLENTSSQITLNGQIYRPNQPFVAIFSPFSLHHADFFDNVPVGRYVYYFDDVMIDNHPDEFKTFESYRQSTAVIFTISLDFAEKLRPLHENALKHRHDDSIIKLLFLMNLHMLLKEKTNCILLHTNSQMSNINRIVRYMTEHFSENLTAESVAQRFFISRSKLNRDFRDYTTVSFRQFLIELRISKAKFMLKQGTDIREIATSIGFENESYFCQFFKKSLGITPLQYRKQQNTASKTKK